MSVQVPSSSAIQTTVKRSKSVKRKHEDISQVLATPERSPSPTKKAKRSQDDTKSVKVHTEVASKPDLDGGIFSILSASFYLPIAPISLQSPIAGLCAEHLSPLLLTYYPPLKGIVLSYSNPNLSESPRKTSRSPKSENPVLALSIAEYGPTYAWLTADFLILSPSSGSRVEGWINVQSETHLGLMCWNLFNATVPFERLPQDWTWIEGVTSAGGNGQKRREKLKGMLAADEDVSMTEVATDEYEQDKGHWVDGQGREISGSVAFRVVMIDADGGNEQDGNFVSIIGTMLDEDNETKVLEQERQLWEKRWARKSRSSKTNKSLKSNTDLENGDTGKAMNKPSNSLKKKHKLRQE